MDRDQQGLHKLYKIIDDGSWTSIKLYMRSKETRWSKVRLQLLEIMTKHNRHT